MDINTVNELKDVQESSSQPIAIADQDQIDAKTENSTDSEEFVVVSVYYYRNYSI